MISSRQFALCALLVVTLLTLLFCRHDTTGDSRAAPVVTPGPRWVKEGIVATAQVEPLVFLLRRGGGRADVLDQRAAERSEERVKFWKDAGINLIIITLHKGFGLQTEAEDIEATRKFVQLAHRHDLKVGGYVGASLMYETFFAEEPKARDWMQVDEWGRPIYYTSDQTFRYMACRNNPEYQEFLLKVLRLGVEDLKLDLLHFDQLRTGPEPRTCRCHYCQEEFRKYLRSKYADPRLKMRFGFTRLDGVIPPPYAVDEPQIPMAELRNPVMQEWALFRAANLAQWWGEVSNYIHGLNPEVAVLGNPTMYPSANNGFIFGVDPSQLLRHGEIAWSEEPNLAEWTSDGRLVSKIRTYKAVRSMGRTMMAWQAAKSPLEWRSRAEEYKTVGLHLAEAIAYNDTCLGSFRAPEDLTPEARRYIRFFNDHREQLRDTATVADAAILRSFASIEFNPSQSNWSTILFEQSLIQGKVPFAVIFDLHLKDLGRYKVLVMANQDALSDEQAALIRRFVEAGGGLVATEDTSLLTEWRRRRLKFALADLFGINEPAESGNSAASVRRGYGKGRVVYVPEIVPATGAPPARMNHHVSNEYWRLPKNHWLLMDAVRWAAGGRLTAEIDTPEWVTMELAEQRDTGLWLLHLVNYNPESTVANISVRLIVPPGKKLRTALIESPDDDSREVVPVVMSGQSATFRVPKLRIYDLVQLRFE